MLSVDGCIKSVKYIKILKSCTIRKVGCFSINPHFLFGLLVVNFSSQIVGLLSIIFFHIYWRLANSKTDVKPWVANFYPVSYISSTCCLASNLSYALYIYIYVWIQTRERKKKRDSPIGSSCRLRQPHLCRGVRCPLSNECSGYDTKLHLTVRLQYWSFGECVVPFRAITFRYTLTWVCSTCQGPICRSNRTVWLFTKLETI